MPTRAVLAVAVADEHITPWLGLQHEGEILRAHGRFDRRVHGRRPHHRAHRLDRECGLFRVVDQRRIVALEAEVDGGIEACRHAPRHRLHTFLDEVQHGGREGAHGADQHRFVGNHIRGAARVNLRDRQHRRFQRILFARNDGLPGLRDLHCHHHRVDAAVRLRGVRALAFDGHAELVTGCHHRPRDHTEAACRQAWPVVHAVHGVHRELVEQTILDHLARAGAAFFGGLENQVHRAVEVAVTRQIVGCAQQHRGMTVVTACMHLAGVARRMVKCVEFLHGQRVHVGAQADCARRVAILDDADHAGDAQPAHDGNAPFGQARSHHVGGALFFVAEFRMGVDVAPDLFQFGLESEDRFYQSHLVLPSSMVFN